MPDLDLTNVGQSLYHEFRPHSRPLQEALEDPRTALRLYRQIEQLIKETRPDLAPPDLSANTLVGLRDRLGLSTEPGWAAQDRGWLGYWGANARMQASRDDNHRRMLDAHAGNREAMADNAFDAFRMVTAGRDLDNILLRMDPKRPPEFSPPNDPRIPGYWVSMDKPDAALLGHEIGHYRDALKYPNDDEFRAGVNHILARLDVSNLNSPMHRAGRAGVDLAGIGHYRAEAARYGLPGYASDIMAAAAPFLNAPEVAKELAREHAATHAAREKLFSPRPGPPLAKVIDARELRRQALRPVPAAGPGGKWPASASALWSGLPDVGARSISIRNPFLAPDGLLARRPGDDAALEAALDTYRYPALAYSRAAVEANTEARFARGQIAPGRSWLNWRPAPTPPLAPVLKRGSAGAGPDWLGRPWWAVFGR
jgi:hypothetical protein